MCTAFPCSDYYGDSAPRTRRRWTWQLAAFRARSARLEVHTFQELTLDAIGGDSIPGSADRESIGARSRHTRDGCIQLLLVFNQTLAAWLAFLRGIGPYRDFCIASLGDIVSTFTLASAVARLGCFHRRGQLRSFGYCRSLFQSQRRSRSPSASGPTRTRMASISPSVTSQFSCHTPMSDVVALDERAMGATRESTASVANVQRT